MSEAYSCLDARSERCIAETKEDDSYADGRIGRLSGKYRINNRKLSKRFFSPSRAILLLTVFVVASCASIKIVDEASIKGPLGYVGFMSSLEIVIYPIVDGERAKPYIYNLLLSKPKEYLIAETPGQHEFEIELLRGRGFNSRVKVDVREGHISFVTIQAQYLDSRTSMSNDFLRHETTTTTKTSFRIFVTVGSYPIPFKSEGDFASTLMDALDDSDWGTRTAALSRIRDWNVRLSPEDFDKLLVLARDDRYEEPRIIARGLLMKGKQKILEDPLYLCTFVDRSDNFPESREAGASDIRYFADGLEMVCYNDNVSLKLMNIPEKAKGIKNLDFELDCTWKEGDPRHLYGLLLGKDVDNLVGLFISRNGSAVASLMQTGKAQILIPPMNRGGNGARMEKTIRIVAALRGDTCSFFAEGERIGEFQMPPDLGLGCYGFAISGTQTISFNRVAIYAR